MANYTDYLVVINTKNPLLVDLLASIVNKENTFLEVFSVNEKTRKDINYGDLSLQEYSENSFSFSLYMSVKYGLDDENTFQDIYDKYCEFEENLEITVKIHDEINHYSLAIFYNGEWSYDDSLDFEDSEDSEDSEEFEDSEYFDD